MTHSRDQSTALRHVTDCHIHIQPWEMLRPEVRSQILDPRREDTALVRTLSNDPGALVEHLRAQGVARAALINYVAPETMGFTRECNDWVTRFTWGHRDRLLPVGSVHPTHTPDVAGEMDRILDLGVAMIKIHPPHQGFRANAYLDELPSLRHVYGKAQAAGVPVMVHTGTSVFRGARSRLGDPMDCDDVAVDFPELTLLLAHGGRPLWMESAFFLARRHPGVYLDLSGIPPAKLLDYFPRLTMVAGKAVFGTDWPSPGVRSVGQNLRAVNDLPLAPADRDRILAGNAEAIWGPCPPL